MKYQDVCEIVAGLALKGFYPPNAIPTAKLLSPYDDMIRFLQKNGGASAETIIQKFGLIGYQAAERAASSLNGTTRSDWLALLNDSYNKYCLGEIMEQNSRRLKEGKDADYAKISSQLTTMDTAESRGILLSDVTDDFVPFQKCGYEPFDTHFGGIPQQGLVLIGAKSKSGKTTLLIDIVIAYLKFQTEKDAAIFSLEMIRQEFKARAKELGMPKSIMNRVMIWDGSLSASEIMAEVSREQLRRNMSGGRPFGIIGADFADLMVPDNEENSEAVFANIYRIMTKMAKTMKLPVFLLAQLSGSYQGGLPRPNHIRYTRLAEALSWMTIMLYNPNTDWSDLKDVELPLMAGHGYIIVWACRGGFRKHKGPGAIQIKWDGGRGWGKISEVWHPLVKLE